MIADAGRSKRRTPVLMDKNGVPGPPHIYYTVHKSLMVLCVHFHFEENRGLCILIDPCVGQIYLAGVNLKAFESPPCHDGPFSHGALVPFTSTPRNRPLAPEATALDKGMKCRFRRQVNLPERVQVSAHIGEERCSTGQECCHLLVARVDAEG